MKRIMTIQDISCVGKCSLTVALPIISAMGVETAVIPTAVLSAHTVFRNFTYKDMSDQIEPICDHWQAEGITFDGIYTGYLGSFEQIDMMARVFDAFKTAENVILVDPVMADHGKLYPTFDEAFAAKMATLCAKADIIVPNITEACFMTGTEYREVYDETYVKELLLKLAALGAKVSILTGGKETFSQFRLEYYSDEFNSRLGTSPRILMERNFQSIRRYALTFTPNADNLLFVGGTGLGKTFLAACVARVVADRGYSVCYETASHLFAKLEQAKFTPTEDSRRAAAKLTECDLLIIDDLGTEMPGQFVTAALYSLLNDRLLAGKPMLITTNLNVEEMGRRYSPQIASRIFGGFVGKTFLGDDIRIQKSKGI